MEDDVAVDLVFRVAPFQAFPHVDIFPDHHNLAGILGFLRTVRS